MTIKTSRKDIIWNYMGNVLNIGVNIIILPIILKMLSSQEMGLWYVFASISTFVSLMDFGFSPTIMRNVTYAWSGSKDILREGIININKEGKPNYSLLKSLLISSKRIYFIISFIAGIIMLTIGSFYIASISQDNDMKYMTAWLIYATAVSLNLFYGYWSPIIKGIGKIKEANQIMLVTKVVYIVISVVGLMLSGGLLSLSLSYLISGLLLWILSMKYFNGLVGDILKNTVIDDKYQTGKMFGTIWYNAKKQGIVTLGAWLITRASTLLCSSFLGLEVTAQYGLSLQLLGAVGSFSSLLFNSYIPELASSKISNDNQRFNLIFSRAIVLQWLTGIIGIAFVILLGPIALKMIGSNSNLLPQSILFILGTVLFLEWNHSTFATLITLSNTVPFVNSSIYSGIIIVAFSLLILYFTKMGILGLVLSQGIVQLSYNNWYWPRLVFRQNNSSVIKSLSLSFKDSRYQIKIFLKNKSHNNN